MIKIKFADETIKAAMDLFYTLPPRSFGVGGVREDWRQVAELLEVNANEQVAELFDGSAGLLEARAERAEQRLHELREEVVEALTAELMGESLEARNTVRRLATALHAVIHERVIIPAHVTWPTEEAP